MRKALSLQVNHAYPVWGITTWLGCSHTKLGHNSERRLRGQWQVEMLIGRCRGSKNSKDQSLSLSM